jgi:hypothetical protein
MNHTASHVLTSTARIICGITPAGRGLLAGLGQEDAKSLHDAVLPILLDAWNMREVDTREAVKFIENLRDKAISTSREKSKRDFDDWVTEALAGNAKTAYRWIGQDSRAPPADLVLARGADNGRQIVSDPDTVAELHAEPWRRRWECGNMDEAMDELGLVRVRRRELRDSAATYASHLDMSPKAIRRSCATFRKDTAVGADDVDFQTVAALPDDALQLMGSLMRSLVASSTLPLSGLLVVLNLLGKKRRRGSHNRDDGLGLQAHHAIERRRYQ